MIKAKQLSAVLALLLAFVMLFSVLYIALEADHDCCGEDCVICVQLQVCESLLRNLFAAAALLLALWSFCAVILAAAEPVSRIARPHTLIALKVKLSD
ncbi:MAG: hypothetical protein K6F56_10145 [Oscillospiraceae bacterium]|nr:hypothetical protein [Oscillospiraceae bacterium]